jgi:NADP-dependent 3-hydroxy acid dehydrogenase YdfG
MVAIESVQKSNKLIADTFPDGLVAVFVGATSGIGEYTLLEFARCAPARSRIYFVGRSTEAGARIKSECEKLQPQSTFEFIASDISLLKNVDLVCKQIKDIESRVNLLFQTQGTWDSNTGLRFPPDLTGIC